MDDYNKHIVPKSDILEDEILDISPSILLELLKDHSATRATFSPEQVKAGKQVNIFWATDIYEQRYGSGNGYDYHDPITIEKITGENGHVVQPRVNKSKEEQEKRSRGVNNAADGKWNITTKLRILKPNEIVTETYIILGCFDTEEEALNFASYIKTKFVCFLVSLSMTSMHINAENFKFVPIQDFKKPWNDNTLYTMYNLNLEEQMYINSLIREMD